ncbi:sensor histidine kinase [Streptomyces sp. NPDC059785]|uniref:sensor histidine kinase n=1 Tax=Streptomyces sp. NPDC059785 TaxID=3346945 RepID=UPI00365F21C7
MHDRREAVAGLLRRLTALHVRHRRILPLIFATTFTSERASAVYEPMFAALLKGGFRPDQLRLIVAAVEFQVFGLAQGLPEPAVSEHIRETLPAYTVSVDNSRYDLVTATEFSVAMGGTTAPEQSPHAPAPGLADLERLVAATAGARVRVDVRCTGERRPVPADIDLSAYRIVQEAVTNVVRHAATGHCRVAIDYGDEKLSVEVVDDGRGAREDSWDHGFGIIGMRERVGLLGGHFTAGPRSEGGFRVAARLPLPAPAGVRVEAP